MICSDGSDKCLAGTLYIKNYIRSHVKYVDEKEQERIFFFKKKKTKGKETKGNSNMFIACTVKGRDNFRSVE